MAFPGSSIVPKKLVESGHDLNAKPVGSGPFKFVSYEPRSAIKFERNPDYFQKGKPYFDAMEYRIIPDVTALTDAVMSGEVNFSNEIPPKDWAAVSGNGDLATQALEGSRYYWLLPNNKNKPLDNPKVRQAIGLALDRKALVAGAFFGQATRDPRRRGAEMELGLRRHQLLQGGRRCRGRQEAAGRGRLSRRVRNVDDHGFVFPCHDGDGADHPGQSCRRRHQGDDRHDGNPALLGRGVGAEQVRHHHHVLGEPACRSRRLRHQQLQMRHGHQRAEELQPGDGCDPRRGQGRQPRQEERKAAYKKMQELSLQEMGIVPLVNAYILIAHDKKLQGFMPLRTGFLKTLKDSWFES